MAEVPASVQDAAVRADNTIEAVNVYLFIGNKDYAVVLSVLFQEKCLVSMF